MGLSNHLFIQANTKKGTKVPDFVPIEAPTSEAVKQAAPKKSVLEELFGHF